MAHATAVINVVGLSRSLLGHAPRLSAFAQQGGVRALRPVLPAVTCSVQSSMLTGAPVREHGIVGNGWYDRTLADVQFWKQSNRLVGGEKVWETARRRDPTVTCANLFWWFNVYSSVDWSVTPRPIYKADGRKIPDCYSSPPELRDRIFYPFFTTRERGSGIGLASVQKIVAGHGGSLRLEAGAAGGATFLVELPQGAGEGAA